MIDDPILAPSIEQYRHYRATVRIRRGDGWEVRPEAEDLDGKRYTFQASWLMDDDDPYPGEWAMTFEDGPESLLWVASGDLVDVEEVERDSMLVRAERMEHRLLNTAGERWVGSPEHSLLSQAALLIQQLRVRLEGEGHAHGK